MNEVRFLGREKTQKLKEARKIIKKVESFLVIYSQVAMTNRLQKAEAARMYSQGVQVNGQWLLPLQQRAGAHCFPIGNPG